MNWLQQFFLSSIGRKIIMSLSGLFLILFLVVHLSGNLQLLIPDDGRQFNLYANFMTTNPFIKFTSWGLYATILLHAIQGWMLWSSNRKARGANRYAVKVTRAASTNGYAARNMGWLGTIIFIFLLLHLYQFWLQMKLDFLPYETYDGETVKNLYAPVKAAFSDPLYVLIYLVSMVMVGLHLHHGFQSAFQTLGLNHRRLGGVIKGLGNIYAILIPAGFAIIPIWMYLNS